MVVGMLYTARGPLLGNEREREGHKSATQALQGGRGMVVYLGGSSSSSSGGSSSSSAISSADHASTLVHMPGKLAACVAAPSRWRL